MDAFRSQDLEDLKQLGISEASALEQLERLNTGSAHVELVRPCRLEDGILRFSPQETQRYREIYHAAQAEGRVSKFVPASGAASRMFQDLFAWMQASETTAPSKAVETFINHLQQMPFYEELRGRLGEPRALLQFILAAPGLNYAQRPKALIPFHRYPHEVRSALQEHLAEGGRYLFDRQGRCRFHFTVAPEHAAAIRDQALAEAKKAQSRHLSFDLGFSEQELSTSTLALEVSGEIFRDERGKILWRPGGHGALLQNLQTSGGDWVFIKNIDNVSYDRGDPDRFALTEAMGGLLGELQRECGDLMARLSGPSGDPSALAAAEHWLRKYFFVEGSLSKPELLRRLSRPLRVCGMVQNRGEVGGGPFWVRAKTGEVSAQIVEASQVDRDQPPQRQILQSATHFNPVDMVCGLKDHSGRPFELKDFRDATQVFITQKSYQGRALLALEWPGLWNGGMAFWNTVFVELPASQFTPVKTVLDLLRPEHQP